MPIAANEKTMQTPSVEVLTSTAGLGEFESEWSLFAREDLSATPFQTPDWLLRWWAHFGSGELRVMIFRDRERVVGVLPLFLHEWRARSQLTLIGSGITDYLDPLFAPDYAPCIVGLIARELKKWPDWEICDWQDLSRDSLLLSLGEAEADTPCSTIPMEPSFDKFLAMRPADLRRNLRRDRARAERVAPVVFRVVHEPDVSLVSAAVALHAKRWQKLGQSGMVEANGAERFLREAVAVFARRGSVRMFVLEFGGQIAAAILALCDRKTIFGYLSAFDPEYEKFSFGREVLAEAIRYAHENGFQTWNFLRGEESYKFLWGAQALEKRRVIIRR